MNALQIPVASVGEEGLQVRAVLSEREIRPDDVKEFPLGPVSITGSLSHSGDEYLFFGRVSGTFIGRCDRCLEPAEVPFDVEVAWTFVSGAAPHPLEQLVDSEQDELDEQMAIPFDGQVIDLLPTAWEEVVLATPLKFLCKEDCAGLCPKCGADLNQGPCRCSSVDEGKLGSKGLAGLADLFPGLKSNRSED
ncbi:MAG: hypothetical protein AMXMBFR4_24260 [Candidatus Hydrogenedentota bacterium]